LLWSSVGKEWGQVHRQADSKAQYFGVGVHCLLLGAVGDKVLLLFLELMDPFSFGLKCETATGILNTTGNLFERLRVMQV